MSRWMNVQAEFEFQPTITEEQALNTVSTENDLEIVGSEGGCHWNVYTDSVGRIVVSTDSNLRDRGWDGDFDDAREWFRDLVRNHPAIVQASMQLHVSSYFICGFYYSSKRYREVNADLRDFIDTEERDH